MTDQDQGPNHKQDHHEVDVDFPDIEKFFTQEQLRKIHSAVFDKITLLAISASAFIAALAWDGALKALFAELFSKAGSLGGKFLYALAVTTLAILISVILGKYARRKLSDRSESR